MQLVGAILFLTSAIALFYVAAGYPLVLALLARRPKPVFPKPFLPTVNVLLPVHNGAAWMRQKLESILALDYPRELMTILVISDGSDDGTDDIVREASTLLDDDDAYRAMASKVNPYGDGTARFKIVRRILEDAAPRSRSA